MKKFEYNLNVLNTWSPQLAYVLGLALADGNVNKYLTRISFYSSDYQMLEVVQGFFESTRPIVPHSAPSTTFSVKREKAYTGKKQMYAFYADSRYAVERFCQFGITPSKSYTGPYPIIAQEEWWHFFRGVLDGDGNICIPQKGGLRLTIAGNKNCITGLHNDLFQNFSIRSYHKNLEKDEVKLLFLYGNNAEKALTMIYQNSTNLRLERKYNQWIEWNTHVKLTINCLLCDAVIRCSQGQKLCSSCRVVRQRLMNRRSDHYRRNGIWLSLRELCKPEEMHFSVEKLDRH